MMTILEGGEVRRADTHLNARRMELSLEPVLLVVRVEEVRTCLLRMLAYILVVLLCGVCLGDILWKCDHELSVSHQAGVYCCRCPKAANRRSWWGEANCRRCSSITPGIWISGNVVTRIPVIFTVLMLSASKPTRNRMLSGYSRAQ